MIIFKKKATSAVTTPSSGKVALFVDSADGIPKYKDDAGTTNSLQGAAGATGAAGPDPDYGLIFMLAGQPGAPGATGATGPAGAGADEGLLWMGHQQQPANLWLPILVRKPSDESYSASTTPQSDDDLKWWMEANSIYQFEFWVPYTCASATPKMKFGFSVPSGATGKTSVFGWTSGGGAATSLTFGRGDLTTTYTRDTTAGGSITAEIKGSVTNGSTAGLFNLQWSPSASTGTNVTVESGAYLLARRVA